IAFQKKEHKGVRNINFILNYLDNEESFEFTYQDSGPGLSKEINDKNDIFEPLFTTNSDGGTGLGLWIVKTIVEEYKGEVKVLDSENGFQLYFKFPLRKRGEGILFNV
ncbi:ATP-binding protein, partial [Streptomyces vietnamensis]